VFFPPDPADTRRSSPVGEEQQLEAMALTICGSPAVIIYYKIASEPRRSGATAG